MSSVWQRATGMVESGQLVPLRPERLAAILASLEGQRVEAAFRREQRRRTLPQNALLHVLVWAIANETGETPLRTKRLATLEALGVEDGLISKRVLGRRVLDVKPTASLSRGECSRVIETLVEHCGFLNLQRPAAEDVEVLA